MGKNEGWVEGRDVIGKYLKGKGKGGREGRTEVKKKERRERRKVSMEEGQREG